MSLQLDQFLNSSPTDTEYLEIIPPTDGWQAALETAGWIIIPVIQAGRVVYDLIRKVNLPTIAAVPAPLAAQLKFPLGANGNKALFRRHPYDQLRYLPVAEYNPYVFKDKIAELARVMISAGATSFEIVADSASTSEIVAEASGFVQANVSGSLKASRKGATKILWSYSGSGESVGSLPEGLFWYYHEQDWQVIWESAVYSGAKSHSLEIHQDTSHEISSELAAKFTGAGFKLGGSFRQVGASNLKMLVTFS